MSANKIIGRISRLNIPASAKAELLMLWRRVNRLAEFIALELYESFDPEAVDGEQLATAVKVMQSAVQTVAHALANMGRERVEA